MGSLFNFNRATAPTRASKQRAALGGSSTPPAPPYLAFANDLLEFDFKNPSSLVDEEFEKSSRQSRTNPSKLTRLQGGRLTGRMSGVLYLPVSLDALGIREGILGWRGHLTDFENVQTSCNRGVRLMPTCGVPVFFVLKKFR